MYNSWGFPFETHKSVIKPVWRNEALDFSQADLVLPYGCGRSYGDVCLNDSGKLIDVTGLNHFINFDDNTGVIKVESGITLDYLLNIIIPLGWFIPVTPGTRFVTIGGMVANDVHGKNHHNAGTIGCHITQLELYRSNGERLLCSPKKNATFFNATIGGLGLTGLITWVEIKLKKITNEFIAMNTMRIENLSQYFDLEKHVQTEYSVAWIDTLAKGNQLGRGVYFTGEHMQDNCIAENKNIKHYRSRKKLFVPFNLPTISLNKYTVKLFNSVYRRNAISNKKEVNYSHYQKYFYPLDNVLHWNRIYGKTGLFQHQCVIPERDAEVTLTEILSIVAKQNNSSFLSVLKKFGNIKSPGLLSFPRPGFTLAMDFSRRGKDTIKLLESLNDIIKSVGGAIYPAKDALMSKELFYQSYPNLEQFKTLLDPKFSSSFWRRVIR
ncbi:Putative oxidoreductase [hydrothermal vent metagenome]|uniref:Oxidoreductase n=1 Tax=hydrothermal vent metagenome TaxID=652676 RepID=A0A3B1A251_9ZZZZ